MSLLSAAELQTKFARAIVSGGGSISAFSPQGLTFDVDVVDDVGAIRRKVFLRNITPGGGGRQPYEFRIQIDSPATTLAPPVGGLTLVIGWDDTYNVFAAWHAAQYDTRQRSFVSAYVWEDFLRDAQSQGIATQDRNGEIVICLRPEFLLDYSRDPSTFHGIMPGSSDEAALRALLAAAPMATRGDVETLESRLSAQRKSAIVTMVRRERSRDFRRRVLQAYGAACAVCGMSLGLVEAAHIVPVRESASTDETANGLALCAEHHAAYDLGLILIDELGDVHVNEDRVQRFVASGQGGGESTFRSRLSATIASPTKSEEKPNPSYLRLGRELRRVQ